jgi:cardiolipin synthase
MSRHTIIARLLVLIALVGAIASCKSLPSIDDLPEQAPPKANPTIETAKGALPPKQAAQLASRRWANAGPDLKLLAVLEEQATGVPLIAGNKVTLLFDGPATMREMMAAVRAATSTINLETYIFDQDQVGLQFADLLIEKRKQGLVVNVMYDAVGTLGTPQAFFDRMKAAGINMLPFNPVNPAQRPGKWELNNRDHRKLMVVDGKTAFTGGINISSTYANSSFFRSRARPTRPATRSAGATPTSRSRGRRSPRCNGPSSTTGCARPGATCPKPIIFPRRQPPGTRSCACSRPSRTTTPRSTNRCWSRSAKRRNPFTSLPATSCPTNR